ncbi:MAG: hypothetical protein GSR86_03830 [Desulfurococcales archaeon]|nr:hypothetical protein [Desulfurococcales archaeon]
MATRRITVEVEVPEWLVREEGIAERLARASVRLLLADLLAEEAGLSEEEALWMERRVKKRLGERRSS